MYLANELNDSFYKSCTIFSRAADVKELANIMLPIGMSYFTMDRHFYDGSRWTLTTAPCWIEHYWREKLFSKAVFEVDAKSFLDGYIFWDWLVREPIYSEASLYGIDNGITITERGDEFCDFFHFAPSGGSILSKSTILDMICLLNNFINEFKYKAGKLINEANQNKILVPCENNRITEKCISECFDGKTVCDVLLNDGVRKIYIGDHCYLTMREIEIIRCLIGGASSKQVSNKLTISTKTFEFHIKNIKEKLNSNSIFEAAFKLGKLSAKHILPIADIK